jgi:hypothetical protein
MQVSNIRLQAPHHKSINKLKRLESIIGLDTKTLASIGYAFLICTSNDKAIWVRRFEDLLPIITSGNSYGCYNLDLNAQAILKWFGEEFCGALFEGFTQQRYWDIDVWYIPGKMLCFIKGNTWTYLYDVAQYYTMGWHPTPLKLAGYRWVHILKKEFPNVDELDESFYDNAQLAECCILDAKIAGALGNLVINTYERQLGIPVTSLSSPASIAETFCLDYNRTWIPNIKDIPLEALQYMENAVQPPFRAFFKMSYFPAVYTNDINSAFPSKMIELPDMSRGTWSHFRGSPPVNCIQAYTKCTLDIPKSYMSWVTVHTDDNKDLIAYGRFNKVLNLKGLYSLPVGTKVKPIDGWAFTPEGVVKCPYKEVVGRLLQLKYAYPPDSLERELAKKLTSTLHGKFRQIGHNRLDGKLESGRMYMPGYEADCMTAVTLQVYNLMSQIPQEHRIGVHTDCIYTDLSLDMPLSSRPGRWDFRKVEPFLVVGINTVERKGEEGTLYKAFKSSPNLTDYPDPYSFSQNPVSLAQAIARRKFDEAGVFVPTKDTINIRRQLTGRSHSGPTTGGELLSKVWDTEMLSVEWLCLDKFSTPKN